MEQFIRTPQGTLDMPILYCDKQAEGVTEKDIEKARNCQKKYGTNYVILVSPNLPKNVKNKLFGEKTASYLHIQA